MDLAILIETLGPTGAILAAGIMAARALMPLIVAAVGHLGKIADATHQLALGLQTVDKKIDQVADNTDRRLESMADQLGEIQQDLAGIYASAGRPRPSRAQQRQQGQQGQQAAAVGASAGD